MNMRLVVMRRWKFLLLLFICMCISSGFSIAMMAKFLLRQDENMFPLVVSAILLTEVFSILAGMVGVACVAAIGIIRRISFNDSISFGCGKET